MPETALDQNDGPFTRQHDVRRPGQLSVVQSEAQAARVESTSEGYFRTRVFAPDACHHAGTGGGINDVDQFYPLALSSRPGKAAP
jgi:hypothetical protein